MRAIRDLRPGAAAVLSALLFALAPAPAAAIDPSYSGSWYNPPESGSGFNLEIFDDDRALLFWYTYDDAGDAVWLYSEGAIQGGTIDFDVYYSEGMRFSDLDTADETKRRWGTLSMAFQDCNNATITYQSTLTGVAHSPVGERTMPVQRLVNIDSLPCRNWMSGYWKGSFDTIDVEGVVTEQGVAYMHDSNGTVYRGSFDGVFKNSGIVGMWRADYGPASAQGAIVTYTTKDFIHADAQYRDDGYSLLSPGVAMSYRPLYDREVPLESLAGPWSQSLTILPDGSFTMTLEGCTYSGQFIHPDAAFNLFTYSGTSSCEGMSIDGVAVNVDDVPGGGHVGDLDALELTGFLEGPGSEQKSYFLRATRL